MQLKIISNVNRQHLKSMWVLWIFWNWMVDKSFKYWSPSVRSKAKWDDLIKDRWIWKVFPITYKHKKSSSIKANASTMIIAMIWIANAKLIRIWVWQEGRIWWPKTMAWKALLCLQQIWKYSNTDSMNESGLIWRRMGPIIVQVVDRHDGSSKRRKISDKVCDKVIGSCCELACEYSISRGSKTSADCRMYKSD
jgi:hypothetical protein